MKVLVWAFLVLGIGATGCVAQTAERRFERSFSVNGAVFLDLTTDAGGILVRPGASGTVRVRGILKPQWSLLSGRDAEDRIQLRARADSGGIDVQGIHGPIDCQTDSGGVRVTDIGADVRAKTDSGGIHIRKVNGEVRAHADSGGIEALEVRGRVEAETDSGGIRISQTQPASIHARADSGGADIALANAAGYDITARSESGRITAPDITPTGKQSRGVLDGRLRGGGPLVDVRVDSGSVTIH
jgi:hypothetical protein